MQRAELAAICQCHGLRLQQLLQQGSDSFTARVRDEAGRDFVLKRLDPTFGAGVRAGLTAWADSGLTPRLVAELEPDLVLIEWISGASMSESATDHPLDVPRIGRSIAQLHSAAMPSAVADVRDVFRHLADTWDELPPDLQPLADELTSVLWTANPTPCVLLHGDLVPYNIILTHDRPRFIDPIPTRGFPSWDLAKLAVSWRALGKPGILASLLQGYGSAPPLLAEMVTWITLVYLQKNLPFPSGPLTRNLVPLGEELRATRAPEAFLQRFLSG